jgi:hypothetical protein
VYSPTSEHAFSTDSPFTITLQFWHRAQRVESA